MTKNLKVTFYVLGMAAVIAVACAHNTHNISRITKNEYRNELVSIDSEIEIKLNKEVNEELKTYLTEEQKKSLIHENGKEYLREESKFRVLDESQFDANGNIIKMRMSQEDVKDPKTKTESLIDVKNKKLIENGKESEVNAQAFEQIDFNNTYFARTLDIINDTMRYGSIKNGTITYDDSNRTIRNLILSSEQLNDLADPKDIVKSSISYEINKGNITKVSIDIQTIEATIKVEKVINYEKNKNIEIKEIDKSMSLKEAVTKK